MVKERAACAGLAVSVFLAPAFNYSAHFRFEILHLSDLLLQEILDA